MKAETFRPKVRGKSDFFSWQLYRWLRKHPTRIYVHDIDAVLYVGDRLDGGFLHAAKLRQLCTYGASLTGSVFAYGPCHGTKNATDVTKEFWEKYLDIGVCAIHGDYAHNWKTAGDERVCSHCKKVERKTIEMRPYEVWA